MILVIRPSKSPISRIIHESGGKAKPRYRLRVEVVGTIDLGGAPEQAASDGQGHRYVDIEDQDNVAVVDVKTLKVTAHYDLGGKGGGRAGLGLDAAILGFGVAPDKKLR